MPETHTLGHALAGCGCAMRDITRCVICGKDLAPTRQHVDTCGNVCFRKLLRQQREHHERKGHRNV